MNKYSITAIDHEGSLKQTSGKGEYPLIDDIVMIDSTPYKITQRIWNPRTGELAVVAYYTPELEGI